MRANFYPDGTFIPYQMPPDFRKSLNKKHVVIVAYIQIDEVSVEFIEQLG